MRKILILSTILCIVLISISCKNEPSTASLRVELNKGIRTIGPTSSDMDITGYRIIPTGPDGKEGSARYTYYSYCTLENLQFGQWSIEAYGFNSDRVDIAYGKASIMVASGNNSVTIPVNQLIGEGSLSLSFSWDAKSITNPILKLFIKSQDSIMQETELYPSITISEGTAKLEHAKLNAGSYTLRGELYNGEEKVAGFIEAIRITNAKTTKGEIPFEIGKLDEENTGGNTSIDISNTTSSPIEISIDGVEKIMSKDSSFTATLSILSKNVSSNQISAIWYLDGKQIGKGLSCTISSATLGDHRIDVIASTSDNGSTGSCYATFSTVTTKKQGMPYSFKQIKNSEISLGKSNVIRFLPNGRLLIASNDMQTLELLAIENNDLKKLKTYKFSELGINGTVSDMATSAIPADTNITLYVFTNNDPEIIALSYTKTGDALSYKSKQSGIKISTGEKIQNLGPAIGISHGNFKATVVAASTLNHKNVGVIFLDPNPSSSSNDFIKVNYINDIDIFGEGPIYSLDYSESSDIITAVSGSSGVAYFAKLSTSGQIAQNATPISDDLQKIESGNYHSLVRGIMGRILEGQSQYGYILTHNSLNLYAVNETGPRFPILQSNRSFKFTSHSDKIPALSGSYDNLFFYMIDNLCKKLYVMTFENGEFQCNEENDFINLPSSEYTKIELSRDGRNMILYDPACNTNDIALIQITR